MTVPALQTVFWSAAALVVYVYAGYPLLIWGLARRKPGSAPAPEYLSSVTLIIPAHNEERWVPAED